MRNFQLFTFGLIMFGCTHLVIANTISQDSMPVHYPLMDSIGINFNLEKNLFQLTQQELQNQSLPWWDKSVLYGNYFASAIHLFYPIAEIKQIWNKGYENDPYASCYHIEHEFQRINQIEYFKNIPHVLHCVMMREKDFFHSRCNVLYEQYDSLLMKELANIPTNIKYDQKVQVWLDSVIAKAGKYPGRSMVGMNLEYKVWSVMQKADLAVLEKYLPLLINAVKNKDLHPTFLAASLDKIEVLKGLPQIYGTQHIIKDEKEEPYPIRDMQNLNTLRGGMGLGRFEAKNSSLGDYMENTKRE